MLTWPACELVFCFACFNVFEDLLFTASHYHPVLSELLVKSPRIDQTRLSLYHGLPFSSSPRVGRPMQCFQVLCVCDLYPDLGRLRTKHLLHSIVELEIYNSYFMTYILYILNIFFMLMFFFAFGPWRKGSPSTTWNSPCTPRLALNSLFFMLNRWPCLKFYRSRRNSIKITKRRFKLEIYLLVQWWYLKDGRGHVFFSRRVLAS